MNDPWEIHAAAESASELFLDLGDFITGGRRPPRWLVFSAWAATIAGAWGLWQSFHWLFDHYPGWAVLSGGFWAMWLVVTLGLWSARIRHDNQSVPRE